MPETPSRKLVIPSGSSFETTDNGLVIEAAADIALTGPLAVKLARVSSAHGSVSLSGEVVVDEVSAPRGSVALSGRIIAERISAGGPILAEGQARVTSLHGGGPVTLRGTVDIVTVTSDDSIHSEGKVTVDLLRAPKVSVASGDLVAKAVDGGESITLGEARLTVEILIAPEVHVHPNTHGRVNVIESHNELTPNGIKGGFGLAEYAEFTGIDADDFLVRRGVRRLGSAGSAPKAEPAPAASALDLTEDLITINSEQEEAEPAQQVIPEADLEPVDQAEELDLDEPAVAQPHDELQVQLLDTIDQIASSYAGGDEPPSITTLRELVLQRDYDAVRDQLTSIWNELIRFHQKRNMRVAHKVTIKFNSLNTLVRKTL